MSFVASIAEGGALKSFFRDIHNVTEFPLSIIGILRFKLDVSSLSIADIEDLLDDFDEIDPEPDLFVEDDTAFDVTAAGEVHYVKGGLKVINFEYYITNDLLPKYRAVIDRYCGAYYNCHLLSWTYTEN